MNIYFKNELSLVCNYGLSFSQEKNISNSNVLQKKIIIVAFLALSLLAICLIPFLRRKFGKQAKTVFAQDVEVKFPRTQISKISDVFKKQSIKKIESPKLEVKTWEEVEKLAEEQLEAYRLQLDQKHSQDNPPFMEEMLIGQIFGHPSDGVELIKPSDYVDLMKNDIKKKEVISLYAKIRSDHLYSVKDFYVNFFRNTYGIKDRKGEIWFDSDTHMKLNNFFIDYLKNNHPAIFLQDEKDRLKSDGFIQFYSKLPILSKLVEMHKFGEEQLEAYCLQLDQKYSQENPPFMPEMHMTESEYTELIKNDAEKKKAILCYEKLRLRHLKAVKRSYCNLFMHNSGSKLYKGDWGKGGNWGQSGTCIKLFNFFMSYKINKELQAIFNCNKIEDYLTLKKEFKKWALKNHPDKVPFEKQDNAKELFQKIKNLMEELIANNNWKKKSR